MKAEGLTMGDWYRRLRGSWEMVTGDQCGDG